jgi:hypothetical protein
VNAEVAVVVVRLFGTLARIMPCETLGREEGIEERGN